MAKTKYGKVNIGKTKNVKRYLWAKAHKGQKKSKE